jgi:quercetin dioxygenase-like cupin family protein
MSTRKIALALGLIALLLAGGNAFATTGSGVTASNKVVSTNANIFVRAIGNELKLRFGSPKTPINILNVHQTFAPGGFSGWHTHSGPGIVIVEQGTITIEETEGCFVDYPQGSVLFEGGPGHIHNASNRTGSPVILDAYFFLPAFVPPGGNSRIDEPVQTGPCKVSPDPQDRDDDDDQ